MANRTIEFLLLARDKASQAIDRVGASANRSGREMESAGGRASAFGSKLGLLAAGGVAAVGAIVVSAIKTGLETASGMQQADIAFTQLLGSAQKSKQFVGDLSKFAAATPFEFPGLVDASRTLIGVGATTKQTMQIMQDFGDTSGALAIPQENFQRIITATSQAMSAGKFQAGDLNQIMNNGMPIWSILSKAMHKTVPELRDMASHGKLLAKDVMPALHSQMSKDYGGSMAKQSQTLSGLWSTMKDTFAQGMAQVLMPMLPVLQKYLPGAMTATGKALSTLAGWVKVAVDWGGKLKGWLDGIGKGAGSNPFLQQMGKLLGDVGQQIRTIAGPALEKIGATIKRDVVPALSAFAKAMQPVILWLAQKLAPVVVSTFRMVVTVIQGALKIIAGIFNVVAGLLTGDWRRCWEGIKQIASGAWTAIGGVVRHGITAVKAILTGAIDILKAIGGRILDGLLDGLKAGWGKVKGFFTDLTNKIPDWKGPAKRDKTLLTPAGKSIMGSLISGFKAVEPDVASYLTRFTNSIASRKITQAARTAITHIVEDVSDSLRAKTDMLKAIAGRIGDQKQAIADLVKARADYAGTLAEGASGGSITSIGLLQLDSAGRNAAAQDRLATAQDAHQAATSALTEAQQKLLDLQEQETARDVSTIQQLQALRSAREELTAAEQAAAAARAGLAKAETDAAGANTNRAVDFRDQLAKRLADIKQFTANMDKLKGEGASQAVLQEIAQAGLETGGALAAALAQGSPDIIRQINLLSGQITSTSQTFGGKWSADMYKTGIDAAQGLLKGMESQQSVLEAAITKLGNSLITSIRRSLGIKSPSRRAADEVGAFIPPGIADGILEHAGVIDAAIAEVVPIGAGIGVGGGVAGVGAGRAAAGPQVVNLHIGGGMVMGTPAQLARELQRVLQEASAAGVVVKVGKAS